MKKQSKLFSTRQELAGIIAAYFKYIEGEYHTALKLPKKGADSAETTEEKIWDREAEPATITGLALYLGFNSKAEFNEYEQRGKFAALVKRARLQVETVYEKKLHFQSPTGAIFALKSIGWNEKTEDEKPAVKVKNIKVKIIESGPLPASSEKDVAL